jgi:hypothetical protein
MLILMSKVVRQPDAVLQRKAKITMRAVRPYSIESAWLIGVTVAF